MKTLKTIPGQNLVLGHRGENLATRIIFSIAPWVEVYGPGTAHLLHQRKDDAEPYPVGTVQEGTQISWDVTDADTAVEGYGKYELRYYVGETMVKSSVGETFTMKALQYGSDAPDPIKGWVDHVMEKESEIYEAVNETKRNSEQAASAAEDALSFSNAAEKSAKFADNQAQTAEQFANHAMSYMASAYEHRFVSERASEAAKASAEEAKKAAENAGGGGSAGDAVLYTEQNVPEEKKARARANIDAISKDDIFNTRQGQGETPDYTNLIDIYGYTPGKHMDSDGSLHDNAGTYVSGFIPVKLGDVIRIKDTSQTTINDTLMMALFGEDKAETNGIGRSVAHILTAANNDLGVATIEGNVMTWTLDPINYWHWQNFAYLRVSTFSSNMIVTINEPLTESDKKQLVLKPSIKVSEESLDFDVAGKPLSGKTVVGFGDSIFGYVRDTTSVLSVVAAKTGATVHNVGFGGCRMAVHPTSGYGAFSMWALAKAIADNDWSTQDAQAASGSDYFPDHLALLKSIDFSNVDMVVIHYGSSDFTAGNGVPIDNDADRYDYTTLCGALRYSIEKLLTAYPHLQIYISLPTYCYWSTTDDYPDTHTNVLGRYLHEYADALRNTASEYNLPVIDCFYGLGVNKLNVATMTSDGAHHSDVGRQLLGEFIAGHLNGRQSSGKSGMEDAVLYTKQNYPEEKKARARTNIGAVDETYVKTAINNALGRVDLSDFELLGQAPQYLSGADNVYDIVVDVKGETVVSIESDTVADLSTVTDIKLQGATETYENGIYKLTSTGGGNWFQHRKYFDLKGLVPGERYAIMYDVTGVEQETNSGETYYGQITVHDLEADGMPNIMKETLAVGDGIKKYTFTATSSTIRVYLTCVISSISEFAGIQIQYRDIWINKESANELRTEIYKKELTTSERLVLKGVSGGLTIETTPTADIYSQTVEEEPSVPSILFGKTCVCFGDSITGNYAKLFDYPSVIAEKTGMTVVNGGFGGCRMAKHPTDTYDAYSMYRLADSVVSGDWSVQDAVADAGTPMYAVEHISELKALDWSKVDIVTILFGANDFTGGVGLESDSDPLSTNHYKGAARYSIEKLLTAYPNLRIVLLSPLYHYKTVDGEIVDTDTYTSGGNKMSDFIEALKDVAEEYKLPFFDLYNTLGINKINRKDMLPDGAHPSGAGIKRIGESIAARLTSI